MYNALSNLTKQFVGGEGKNFAPVEVDLYGGAARVLGLLIEELPDKRCGRFCSNCAGRHGRQYLYRRSISNYANCGVCCRDNQRPDPVGCRGQRSLQAVGFELAGMHHEHGQPCTVYEKFSRSSEYSLTPAAAAVSTGYQHICPGFLACSKQFIFDIATAGGHALNF